MKLLNKLERASSELHSDEESDAKHQDTITDRACLQVRKISNLVVWVPHRQSKKKYVFELIIGGYIGSALQQ